MAFFNEPFDPKYLIGHLDWTPSFSDQFGPITKLRHACHETEVWDALRADEVPVGTQCDVKLADGTTAPVACVWAALNNFSARGNHFGPLIFCAPLRRLNGRRFYLLRQQVPGKFRNVFFQYFDGQEFFPKAPEISDPSQFFQREKTGLDRTWDDHFYFALQSPINLVGAALEAEDHSTCVGTKCSGLSRQEAEEIITTARTHDVRSILDWTQKSE